MFKNKFVSEVYTLSNPQAISKPAGLIEYNKSTKEEASSIDDGGLSKYG
jgi:hypothetical protein